ncbi:hypothetical protein [Streptomyces sp. NPDC048669]
MTLDPGRVVMLNALQVFTIVVVGLMVGVEFRVAVIIAAFTLLVAALA